MTEGETRAGGRETRERDKKIERKLGIEEDGNDAVCIEEKHRYIMMCVCVCVEEEHRSEVSDFSGVREKFWKLANERAVSVLYLYITGHDQIYIPVCSLLRRRSYLRSDPPCRRI